MSRADRRERLRAHLSMLAFAVLISGSFSLGARAAALIDPMALTGLRFLIAAAALSCGLVLGTYLRGGKLIDSARAFSPLFRRSWRFSLVGVLYGGYFVLMFEALRLTTPTPLAAVFTLGPLMTAALSFALYRQRSSPGLLLALLIGAAGAVWVVFDGSWDALISFRLGLGETLFLIGAFGHSAFAAIVHRVRGRDGYLSFSLGVLIGAFLIVLATGLGAIIRTEWAALPSIVWITAVYLALPATVVTMLCVQYAAARLPASKVMAYTYLLPTLVILQEGMSGQGWPDAALLPGVAATLISLSLLSRHEEPAKLRAT